ncbi:long-chain acyl-CoA synthetase [Halopolyspora algeriensis]|uniref:Long-chain acyl-CoA synthetase n=1 Tax=Halopolyspora algeriensis TaxID=1500506 RepID=A0A368VUA1_9ACTN|nr:class I adenylate-forming enzyme family protein [Halopolyspora algeriensis]RCW45325.1 long-chain acyl-CoA synthetase [Halopolyspora algeriensis]TQM47365.1 long-chain acyl-CoA synthetase [Halopolyspora algeriensis]
MALHREHDGAGPHGAGGTRPATRHVDAPAEHVTLSRLVAPRAERSGDRTALSYEGERWTYADLSAAADALAFEMTAAGLSGERVALMLPNRPETVLAYLACFTSGAIAAPLNSRYAPPEIEQALGRARPAWLIVHSSRLEALDEVDPAALAGVRVLVVGGGERYESLAPLLTPHPVPRPKEQASEHPAVLFFTSGSTGIPKGVLHSHSSALAMLTSTSEALGDVDAEDVVQVCEPQVHVSGFIATLTTLMSGGTVVLHDGFDVKRYVAGLLEHRPTLICTHIDILAQLVHAPGASREWFSSLRGVYTGGDTVPAALQREFTELSREPIAVGWGMTEAIWLTVVREPHLERDGCIGSPVTGAEVRADERTGELLVRGPMLMSRYWQDEALTRELMAGGWLHTGDLGSQDADGLWWFRGRLKELIVRRTSKITPGEVEAAIDENTAVAAAAVVAAPDRDEGQVPVAFVVPRHGHSLSAADLLDSLRGRIAEYKLPARVHFLDALPLTASGKIARHDLHEPV